MLSGGGYLDQSSTFSIETDMDVRPEPKPALKMSECNRHSLGEGIDF